jgi:hypothetical protein
MKCAQPVSNFALGWRRGRTALLTVAILAVLAVPGTSPAQDAGVSGIPPGPANARGLNGSVNDPSGIGNAARVPAIPPPSTSPVTVPSVAPSTAYRPSSYRALPVQRVAKFKRKRFGSQRPRRTVERAAVRENDRLLGRIPSICRGC